MKRRAVSAVLALFGGLGTVQLWGGCTSDAPSNTNDRTSAAGGDAGEGGTAGIANTGGAAGSRDTDGSAGGPQCSGDWGGCVESVNVYCLFGAFTFDNDCAGDDYCECARSEYEGAGGAGGSGSGGGPTSAEGGAQSSAGAGSVNYSVCNDYRLPEDQSYGNEDCPETEKWSRGDECIIDGECCVVEHYRSCGP
jgi:hypothetical protein